MLFVVSAGLLVAINKQTIQDAVAAHSFEASEQIQEIKTSLNLTPTGQRIFGATAPAIEDRQVFNDTCRKSTHSDEGSLLGCYYDGQMHLFDIADERLSGIMEVTAAHELLHAAYARMSLRETESFQKRVTEFYRGYIKEDQTFEKRMAVYSGLSAARFANELHSVLGTEVRELPEWLENHYKTWFKNRATIVDFYDSYSEVFTELKQEGQALTDQLTTLNDEIDASIAAYSEQVRLFNSEWRLFKERNEAYEFAANPDDFYQLLDDLNAWRDSLEVERKKLEVRISEYEELRLKLEELNHVSNTLRQSMDSAILPLSE